MQPLSALLVPFLAFAATAQPIDEDAAHRADRQQTEALNRRVANDIAKRNAANGSGAESYKAASERYQRELREWRRRVEACRAGYYDACG